VAVAVVHGGALQLAAVELPDYAAEMLDPLASYDVQSEFMYRLSRTICAGCDRDITHTAMGRRKDFLDDSNASQNKNVSPQHRRKA
jgi:hypothetical protein